MPQLWIGNLLIAAVYSLNPATAPDAVYHLEWLLANISSLYQGEAGFLMIQLLTQLAEVYGMIVGVGVAVMFNLFNSYIPRG